MQLINTRNNNYDYLIVFQKKHNNPQRKKVKEKAIIKVVFLPNLGISIMIDSIITTGNSIKIVEYITKNIPSISY